MLIASFRSNDIRPWPSDSLAEGFEIVSRNLFWLSDEQWKRIEPFVPTDVRGVERVDDRRVISGIVRLPGDLWAADDDL